MRRAALASNRIRPKAARLTGDAGATDTARMRPLRSFALRGKAYAAALRRLTRLTANRMPANASAVPRPV